MPERLRIVYEHGNAYVFGTDQIIEASRALPPHTRDSSHAGMIVRRRGHYEFRGEFMTLPKDARPGVVMHGFVLA